MRRLSASVLIITAGFALQPTLSRAGGIQGDMYNLPPNKTTIDPAESIGVQVVEVVDTVNGEDQIASVELLDAMTDKSLGSGQVFFSGPKFQFKVKDLGKGPAVKRVLIVTFSRSFERDNKTFQPTAVLNKVVIDDNPASMLTVDVVVPKPRPATQTYAYCYPTYYPVQAVWCHRPLFGHHRLFRN